VHDFGPIKAQTEEKLATLEKQVNEGSGIQPESDLIRARLEEMIASWVERCPERQGSFRAAKTGDNSLDFGVHLQYAPADEKPIVSLLVLY
jgi:hypothetical protein